ncbi:lipid II:glycine glycyltransferase FemX [Dictyobacter arantiisoli]|uniref:Methicillin resistance protein n=1 Tax=Dictyobacter arantiisoli TaxID=2014874 RepID=A0A5A5T605_9CHLR|nr:peptidoglycan bridge formation glycyltransferase FemA/FemB family protein [Dictyobacter arantiisoli]GCF06665.1 methicillin resistance protein [Dictyobacter arantiisoli]
MEARFITDRQQWNDFVAKSPYGNITQSYEWGELSKDVGSQALHIGVVDDQNNLCAAVLLLVVKMPMLRSSFFYAPRGPIIDDPNAPAMGVLLNFVKSEARKYGAFMLKLEPGVDATDTRWIAALERRGFQPSSQFLHIRNEWILDIRPDEKDILANMKEKWRYNIRLASRKGVTIREGHGRQDLEIFHLILQETAERDHFYIHDVDHFELLSELFEQDDRYALLIAEHEGKAIAAIVLMRMGKWCWYRYGASSSKSRNLMPNHLLQWMGMQWAKAHGCEYYNFLGIPNSLEEPEAQRDPLWGVYSFKRGFNGFSRLSLPGYDLPYNPVLFKAYRSMLDFKNWRAERASKKERAAEAKEEEKQVEAKVAARSVPVARKA